MSLLSQAALHEAAAHKEAGRFGQNVHFFRQVKSTNDIARSMAEASAPDGTIILADEQISGRGRKGRTWDAPPGSSLLMSVLFRPSIPPEQIYRLVMVTGLSAVDACRTYAGVNAEIKWPNDLMAHGKKLAGILPESSFVGNQAEWVITGIGLNVNQKFSPLDPLAASATSLYLASGEIIDRAALFAEFAARLNYWSAKIGSADLVGTWRTCCVTLGQYISVQFGESRIEGMAEDITEAGELVLHLPGGGKRLIPAGEATVIRK